MGQGAVDKFIENAVDHTGATTDESKKLKKEGHNGFVAFAFMDNTNHKKCRVMLKNSREQHALGNDQHSKTLSLAMDALQSHRWDQACTKDKKNGASQKKNNANENIPNK